MVQIACLACAETHLVRLGRQKFWGEEVCRFRCPEIDVEVGYLGPEQAVHRLVDEGREQLRNIANDLGFDDFFNYPQVMLGVLGHLHFLAENENLGCQCGNRQIEVDVFPDKLELRCVSCHSLLIVYSESQEDLAAVRRVPRIVMSERGFASIDASKLSQER